MGWREDIKCKALTRLIPWDLQSTRPAHAQAWAFLLRRFAAAGSSTAAAFCPAFTEQ